MSKIVLSKLSRDVEFVFYNELPQGETSVSTMTRTVRNKILINGGADVMRTDSIITPNGVITHVEDDELEMLQSHSLFQKFIKQGLISFINSDSQRAIDNEVKNMNKSDWRQTTIEEVQKEAGEVGKEASVA